MVTIFLCSMVTMVVVSLLTKPPKEETLNRFFAAPPALKSVGSSDT